MKKIERVFAAIGLLAVVIVAINAVQKPAETTSDSTKKELINDYNVYALSLIHI